MKSSSEARPHDAVTLLVVTWLCLRSYWWLSAKAGRTMEVVSAEALLKLALWAPICLLVVWLMNRRAGRFTLADLGIGGGLWRGLRFGLVATAPMLVAVVMLPKSALDPDMLLGTALIGPLAEELLFRGFLFQQLVQRAGWSVPMAIAVSSVLFGLGHVRGFDFELWTALRGPQFLGYEWVSRGHELVHFTSPEGVWWRHASTRLPFILAYGLPYAAGGALFAWIAYRWKSLWPSIALHGLINLCWGLTQGEQARLGYHLDLLSAAQAVSIVVAIGLTLRLTGNDR